MNNCVAVNKPIGFTPFDMVRIFKKENPKLYNVSVSYAGRLDPMAEGVLLLLIGEENKKRKIYEKLPKIYKFSMVLGLETDSYDILGLLQSLTPKCPPADIEEKIKKLTAEYTGQFVQKYPPYCAALYRKKPLYYWSRRGLCPEEDRPLHVVTVKNIRLLEIKTIKLNRNTILENINKVRGDFRQKEIIGRWNGFFKKNPNYQFTHLSFRISCLSGTYIRQLVSDIGYYLKSGAFTLNITRTSVGKYNLSHTVKISKKRHTCSCTRPDSVHKKTV